METISINQSNKQYLKTMVRGVYDIQALRIQMGNRIVGTFKVKLGQIPGDSEDDMDTEGREILDNLRRHFEKITEGVVKFPTRANFKSDGVIDTYTELCLIAEYAELFSQEKKHFNRLVSVLEDFDIYNKFLEPIKGIGPAMAGVIISEIDIHKTKYPSSLWKYSGLDVTANGEGRSRKAGHLVEREYIDKNGEAAKRNSITFNPWLKTKLVGVLAGSFLKATPNHYRDIYDQYKHRLENNPAHIEKTKGHRHNMCLRYMIKMFLADLYVAWRTLEGLPASVPYAEAKLGLKHGPQSESNPFKDSGASATQKPKEPLRAVPVQKTKRSLRAKKAKKPKVR